MATTCLSRASRRLDWGQRADLWHANPALSPPLSLRFFFHSRFFFVSQPFFLSFPSPFIKVKYPSAMAACFYTLLSSLRLTLRAVFWGTFEAFFEALSEMTCFVHIFKQPPFVMQMDVTLSISRKADACWTDRPETLAARSFDCCEGL